MKRNTQRMKKEGIQQNVAFILIHLKHYDNPYNIPATQHVLSVL